MLTFSLIYFNDYLYKQLIYANLYKQIFNANLHKLLTANFSGSFLKLTTIFISNLFMLIFTSSFLMLTFTRSFFNANNYLYKKLINANEYL